MNLLTGVLDLNNLQQVKKGFSGDLNGNVRWEPGPCLTHDFNGQVAGNLARTGLPGSPNNAGTHDF